MIADWFVDAFYRLIGAVVGFLPTEPPPLGLTSRAEALGGSVGGGLAALAFLPIGILGMAWLAVRLCFLAFSVFRGLVWILTLLHISGGKG